METDRQIGTDLSPPWFHRTELLIGVVFAFLFSGGILAAAALLPPGAAIASGAFILSAAVVDLLRGNLARWEGFFLYPTFAASWLAGMTWGAEVNPALYEAAAQVVPVLLLALGVEQRLLWRRVEDGYDWGALLYSVLFLACALGAALYGSAHCGGTGVCNDEPFLVPAVAGGITGALLQIVVLTVLPPRRDPDWLKTERPQGNG